MPFFTFSVFLHSVTFFKMILPTIVKALEKMRAWLSWQTLHCKYLFFEILRRIF